MTTSQGLKHCKKVKILVLKKQNTENIIQRLAKVSGQPTRHTMSINAIKRSSKLDLDEYFLQFNAVIFDDNCKLP